MNGRPRRRFRRRPARPLAILFVLAIVIAARYFFIGDAPNPPRDQPLVDGTHAIERVVDGDTLLLANDVRVRLIGVDTPETVRPDYPVEPFGPEAAEFTGRFLAGGKAGLTFDRQREDRFGRKLAYVWVDGQLLNEELLRAGLGRWERGYDYAPDMKKRFQKAEREAQAAGLGIWTLEGGAN